MFNRKESNGMKVFNFHPKDKNKPNEQQFLEALQSKSDDIDQYDSNDYDVIETSNGVFVKRRDDKNPFLHPTRTAEYITLNGEKCLITTGIL